MTLWKFNLQDKIKREFFYAVAVLVRLYSCTTWALIKRLNKKLDKIYRRIMCAFLSKFSQSDMSDVIEYSGIVRTNSKGRVSYGYQNLDTQCRPNSQDLHSSLVC